MKINLRAQRFACAIFLLLSFQSISTQMSKKEKTEKYFQDQERIYQDLLKLDIPGACPLNIDEALAEEILASCPQQINEAISGIQQKVFFDNKKNIILHGISGTGKSCIAQAIAIKNHTPCLFFKTGTISTEYMNSGVQNLTKIFAYAQKLEKELEKPCIIIFDELEAFTQKHVDENNNENNILINFWQKLDQLSKSKIVVIGTMHKIDDVPVQMINRVSMIEVPLPNLKQREVILSYYLKELRDKYALVYPEWVTAASLARQTKGFSNRDLQNVVIQAAKPVVLAPILPGVNNKVVIQPYFDDVIKQIKKNPTFKLEREMGTWRHSFKMHLRDPRITLPLAGMAIALGITYNIISNQKESMAIQKESMVQAENIADCQTSDKFRAK